MCDGEDSNRADCLEVDDVIWEALHGAPSDRHVDRKPGDLCACGRETRKVANGGVDGVKELHAQPDSMTLVPAAGLAVLRVGLVLKPNAGIHRLSNSAWARARTSSQGIPRDSPAITRRARLSISAAQAASTSAGSSAETSSRLAKSSAATPARSSIGSSSASRISACARDVIERFYTRTPLPNMALEPIAHLEESMIAPRLSASR